jgi:hypothetical protein
MNSIISAVSKQVSTIKLSSFKKSVLLLIALFCGSAAVRAQGDLLISPLRIVLEGGKKSQEISLANVGRDSATYAISLVDYRMTESGSFEQITEPDSGQNFAGPFLRFFPRKVTLAPNESQVVKLQVVKSSQMKDGEYRSHLYFRAVPDEKPLGEPKKSADSGGISISLKPIFGITIPVLIRVGENDAAVALQDLAFVNQNDTPRVNVSFHRTGSMSVYGDLKVEHVSSLGITKQVGIVRGIGVYTPIPIRKFSMELERKADYTSGKLIVTYILKAGDKIEKKIVDEIKLN